MIAYEHIQTIKLKEMIFVLIVAALISLLLFISYLIFSPTVSFIFSLAFLVLGMNFCVYLIKKTGIATIFYFLTAIFTSHLNDIGALGGQKIFTFFLAGLIFEVIFIFLKAHLHNIPLDMIIGTSLSTASIALITAFALSEGLASSFPLALINYILMALAVGLAASIIVFLIWHNIEKTKLIIKLESYLMSLLR